MIGDKRRFLGPPILALAFSGAQALAGPRAEDPPPSWTEGEAGQAIVDFVARVTRPDSSEFVSPAAQRIVTIDDDGIPRAELPVAIQQHVGRRPIAALGHSDGDLQLLRWPAAGPGPRFCLSGRHTDTERAWACERASSVGRLARGLDEAQAKAGPS